MNKHFQSRYWFENKVLVGVFPLHFRQIDGFLNPSGCASQVVKPYSDACDQLYLLMFSFSFPSFFFFLQQHTYLSHFQTHRCLLTLIAFELLSFDLFLFSKILAPKLILFHLV